MEDQGQVTAIPTCSSHFLSHILLVIEVQQEQQHQEGGSSMAAHGRGGTALPF